MKKSIFVFDLIFYIVLPLFTWYLMREPLGEYYAMLLSTVPAIIYGLIRIILIKKINTIGLFILTILIIGMIINVLSGSAIQMLWNGVFYTYSVSFVFLISILINKPIVLYFAIDLAEIKGRGRASSKALFFTPAILKVFKWITFGIVLKDLLLASIKVWLILTYGVDAFDKGLVVRQLISWFFTGLMIYGFIHISRLIKKQTASTANKVTEELVS